MCISDWSSDVCSSDLHRGDVAEARRSDRDHCEIDDVKEAYDAIMCVIQTLAIGPVDQNDDHDEPEGQPQANGYVGPDRHWNGAAERLQQGLVPLPQHVHGLGTFGNSSSGSTGLPSCRTSK